MEHLIVKFLNNELSQDEWQELRQWLEKNDLNKTGLNNLKSFSSNINYEASELEEVVWNELKTKRNRLSSTALRKPAVPYLSYIRVAAIILLVSTLALITDQLVYNQKANESTLTVATVVKKAPYGRKITTRLPDGSMVTLNSGSEISFSEQFQGNSRGVSLTGEAFFEVEHNPNKPFLVRMNGDVVRVLGTSFNIRSYPEDSAVFVSVATGRVSYSIPSGDEVILEPDRMATYIPDRGSLTTGEVNKLKAFGWKDMVLYFNDITLDKAVAELERWYGVKISYSDDLISTGTYSEQFNNPTLPEVLHSLSFVYRFDFKIEGKKVTLNKIKI